MPEADAASAREDLYANKPEPPHLEQSRPVFILSSGCLRLVIDIKAYGKQQHQSLDPLLPIYAEANK